MDNYDILEVMHISRNNGTIILKVKSNSSTRDGGKIYALKLVGPLDNRLQKLIFKREVEALRRLNSCDNIAKIRDHRLGVEYDGVNTWGAILLDFVYGKNLDEVNLDNCPLTKKFEICMKILRAVEDAHNYSVLHRDIKPSNIMYDEDTDEITLIDFGTSKIKSSIEKETTTPMYSSNYSAPEIVMGNSSTEASDIYSLGAVMFFILFGRTPQGYTMMNRVMERMEITESLKSLIRDMIVEDADARIQEVGQVIDRLEVIIGENEPIKEKYLCSVDIEKLKYLKKKYFIENKATMAILTNSFLKNEFRKCTAFVNTKDQTYMFTGKKIALECSYDTQEKMFKVIRIFAISIDRKISNEKRGFAIRGQLTFIDSSKKYSRIINEANDNEKLLVAFTNSLEASKDMLIQSKLFDELFGAWQDGIQESMDNERKKSGCIRYSKASFTDSQLILTIEDYQNGTIDGLTNEVQYLVEEVDSKGTLFTYDIGCFNNVSYEDDDVILTIDLNNRIMLSKVKALVKKNVPIMENYRMKISAYKRQYYAIRALYDDNYSAKNLKDILLNLEKPTSTPALEEIIFSSDEFNPPQRAAIKKALYSDSISLIQGPPGTGKTKVIKEIVRQVLDHINKIEDTSRILIVSQSHTAVDNIVEGFINSDGQNIDIIRIGREEDISKSVREKCTIEAIRRNMFLEIQKKSNAYIAEKDRMYQEVTEAGELARWKRIKEIQKDWINRCGNLETLDYQVIKSATIIAGTCVGFLSNDFVKELSFDYVIIDEAAKATTPELLVSIIKAKKIILVGDQNQLPAYADRELSPKIAEMTKNPKYRLFDILFDTLPETHKQILTMQLLWSSFFVTFVAKKMDCYLDDIGVFPVCKECFTLPLVVLPLICTENSE